VDLLSLILLIKTQRNKVMIKVETMLSILNTHFPQLDAVDSVEFDSDYEENNGMWFKNSECGLAPDGLPLWDYYMTFGVHKDTDGVHPVLYNMLHEFGFYSEPYDAGTLMAGRL